MLGNPTVKLVHYVDGRDVPVKTAPTAADIAGLGDDYYLDLPGDPLDVSARVRTYAKDFAGAEGRRQGAGDHLRPHRPRAGPLGPRRPVLVLLLLQPVQRRARGRLGGDADRLRRGHAGARRSREGPIADRALPARRRRAGRLGRHQGPEGGHPPDRLSGGRLARDLLRRRDLHRERPARLGRRLRQHLRAAARSSEPAAGHRADPRRARAAQFQWLSYLGHWGQREKGFNNGPHGPDHQDAVAASRSPGWTGSAQDSPRLPGGAILGPAASTAFCGAIAGVSEFINLEAKTTLGAIGLGGRPAAADRRPAAAHPLAPGRHLRACATTGPSASCSAARASSTAGTGGPCCSIALTGVPDPRGDPGAPVPVHARSNGQPGLHGRGSAPAALDAQARRLVRRDRPADRLRDRLRRRGRLHAAAR